MIYDPFSIVIVPFPFTDKIQTKRRPALVLSSKQHQKNTEYITLLMVTSAKHSTWNSDYLIEKMESTGLTSPSIIRQKLFTIDMRLIIEALGKLSNHDSKNVKELLGEHLTIKPKFGSWNRSESD